MEHRETNECGWWRQLHSVLCITASAFTIAGMTAVSISMPLPAAATTPSCGAASGNVVSDCSFESPVVPSGQYATLAPGTALGAWVVGRTVADGKGIPGDAVDLTNRSFHGGYPVHDGLQSLDVNHDAPGGVYQLLPTEAGHVYDLTFYLSGFPAAGATECGSGMAAATNPQTLTVTAGSSTAYFSFNPDTTALPSGNQSFDMETMTFVGAPSSSTTRLSFNGTNAGCTGPIIDDVTVVAAPSDAQPVPNAGGPYIADEGAAVSLTGSVADDGLSPVTVLWTYAAGSDVDAGATCQFGDASAPTTTIACTDDGSYVISLSASDGANSTPNVSNATLTVGNVDPAVHLPSANLQGCSASVSGTFTDPGANDSHTATISWGDGAANASTVTEQSGSGSFSGSHAYAVAGTYTVTAGVTDDDGGSAASSVSLTTRNTAGAFLPPMNVVGTRSVFKLGSTVPIKIGITDCSGTLVGSLAPTVNLVKLDSTPDGAVNETAVDIAPTNGKAMWWNGSAYQYNLSTKQSQFSGGSLTRGTYRVTVSDASLQTPATISFDLA